MSVFGTLSYGIAGALFLVLALLLAVLGFALGEYFGGRGYGPYGVGFALIVWGIMTLVAWTQGDRVLLAVFGLSIVAIIYTSLVALAQEVGADALADQDHVFFVHVFTGNSPDVVFPEHFRIDHSSLLSCIENGPAKIWTVSIIISNGYVQNFTECSLRPLVCQFPKPGRSQKI